jgi:hypothetical protein
MTPIFNGVADSGSYPGVDFYRVDIDNVRDVVEHVGGQTVRWVCRDASSVLAYNLRTR